MFLDAGKRARYGGGFHMDSILSFLTAAGRRGDIVRPSEAAHAFLVRVMSFVRHPRHRVGVIVLLIGLGTMTLGGLTSASGETPTPTPTPTSTPTPTPTPTPAPTEVNVATLQQVFVAAPALPAAPPTPTPPLVFTKTDGRESVQPGMTLTYRITVRNPFDKDLEGVKIVDHVPPFLTPGSTTPGAQRDPKSRTITWRNLSVSALAEIRVSYTAEVQANAPNGFILENTAEINGPGIRGSAGDLTRVVFLSEPAVKAAATPAPPPPPKRPLARPLPPKAVPISADTGFDGGSFLLGFGMILSSLGGMQLRRSAVRAS